VFTNRQFALAHSVDLMRQIGGRAAALAEHWVGPNVFAEAARLLLRHIRSRYAPELVIEDDSGFFESRGYDPRRDLDKASRGARTRPHVTVPSVTGPRIGAHRPSEVRP